MHLKCKLCKLKSATCVRKHDLEIMLQDSYWVMHQIIQIACKIHMFIKFLLQSWELKNVAMFYMSRVLDTCQAFF